jgi:hypothetical protein
MNHDRPVTPPPEALAMRLPRVRFTIRRMMVAVAVAGAGFAYTRWAINDYSLEARENAGRIETVEGYVVLPAFLVVSCSVLVWGLRYNRLRHFPRNSP